MRVYGSLELFQKCDVQQLVSCYGLPNYSQADHKRRSYFSCLVELEPDLRARNDEEERGSDIYVNISV